MITKEQIANVLNNYKKERAIWDITFTADGSVQSRLENLLNRNTIDL